MKAITSITMRAASANNGLPKNRDANDTSAALTVLMSAERKRIT
jgi:hypothetical protein